MAPASKPSRMGYLILAGVAALGPAIALVSWRVDTAPLHRVVDVTSLSGYTTVFLSIVSSAYLRQMLRLFGRALRSVTFLLLPIRLGAITRPVVVVFILKRRQASVRARKPARA